MTATLPSLLAEAAQRTPGRVALREKRLGIWQETTWAAYAATVARLARGLSALGVAPGDRVAIIAENRPQWLYTELAAQTLGAIAVGLYPGTDARALAALLVRLHPRVLVVEGQEQVDHLLAAPAALEGVRAVIYWDGRGMRAYHDPLLHTFESVLEQGGEEPLAALAAETRPEDVALICLTHGLDAEPNLVQLTHANLLAAADGFLQAEPLKPGLNVVSVAPAPWVGDRIWSTAIALRAGLVVNLPEEPHTVAADLREIGPQVVAAPPRAWERLMREVQAHVASTGRLRRRLIENALQGKGAAGPLNALLVARPLKNRLGLINARHCFSMGAPLAPEVQQFFQRLGVPLRTLYGVTEAAGLVALQPVDDPRLETAGKPLPGVTLAIARDGEVLVRGDSVSPGYFDDPGGTAEVFQGLDFCTGDTGRLESDGSLVLTGRRARAARLAGGADVIPEEIEARLRRSPYVHDAIVLARGRPDVVALVAVDAVATRTRVEQDGHQVTGHADLVRSTAVTELVLAAVRQANADLPPGLQVRRVALIPHELSTESGELTAIGHLRRRVVLARNATLVDALDHGEGVLNVEREPAEVS